MKNIIIIEHNSPKEFLFEYADEKGYNIFVVTNEWKEVYTKHRSVRDILLTDVYDIQTSTDNILAYLNKNNLKIDAVGTFSEDLVVLAADVAGILGCKGIGSLSARMTSCNKLATRIKLSEDIAIKQPKFISFNIFDDSDQMLLDFPKPCVIKPVFGIASHGVSMLRDNSFIFEKLKNEILTVVNEKTRAPFRRFKGNMIVEEYIPGTMVSVDGFVSNGELIIVGSLEFVMGEEPHFTQTSSYIPARITGKQNLELTNCLKKITESLGFRDTPFHAEFRINDTGCYLVEIAGRMAGGTIHESYNRVYGIDMIDLMYKCWLGEDINVALTPKGYNYHSFVYPDIGKESIIQTISYPDVSGIEEIYLFNKKCEAGSVLHTYPEMPNSVLEYACFSDDLGRLEGIKNKIEDNIKIKYV